MVPINCDSASEEHTYLNELLSSNAQYLSHDDKHLITKAYRFAYAKHKGQKRRSGDPFILHPVQVAKILIEKKLDVTLIVAALLHDTIEDTDSEFKELVKEFGRDIANIVAGVTKLDKLNLDSTVNDRIQNTHKLMLAVASDDRVILVKLADRLHNMKTIEHMSRDKQRFKASETLYFYAPVAGQLGLYSWREELEDLSFKILYSEARKFVIEHIENLKHERNDGAETSNEIVEVVRNKVEQLLNMKGLRDFSVSTRIKRPYSVWRKMNREKTSATNITDILGVRIITFDDLDIYTVLGVIHNEWKAIFSRFKDYTSLPKENGYRSLHTTVTHQSGRKIEFQIRSRLMHEIAENGIAAHWVHHDDSLVSNPYLVDHDWRDSIRVLVSENASDSTQFFKSFRENILSKSLYCFTPKSDVIWLPKGATVLDFAYELNEDIGDRAMHAYVDHKQVPLNESVLEGQMISIITSTIPFVNQDKLASATTENAKQHTKRLEGYLITQKEIQYGILYLKDAFVQNGKTYSDNAVRTATELLKYTSEDDLLRRVGRREIGTEEVLETLYPRSLRPEKGRIQEPGQPFIDLKEGWTAHIASCCSPVPMERVIGIEEDGHCVTVHSLDCKNLLKHDQLVDIHWHNGPFAAVHPTKISVRLSNSPGILGRVCTIIGESKANINDLTILSRKHDFFDFKIELEVKDQLHLFDVLSTLRTDEGVMWVDRYQDTNTPHFDRS